MGDKCCGGSDSTKIQTHAPKPAAAFRSFGGIPESKIEHSQTLRAREIVLSLGKAIHLDTLPGIGHVHSVLDESEKGRLSLLRQELLAILPQIPESDRDAHLRPVLEAACGSVVAFIQTGQLPDSSFDRFFHALNSLNGHFHEHGPEHKHRLPIPSELPEMHELRKTILALLPALKSDQRIRPALERCCKPTLDFIQSGNI